MKAFLLFLLSFCAFTGHLLAEPLQVGDSLPDTTLKTEEDETVRIHDLVNENEKPAVLIFYRGGWCPYCTAHLSALVEIEMIFRPPDTRSWPSVPINPAN